ncbi:hypothetical protein K1719_026287 [Acacia pycnantha]|nr:hypothetical protein K1719_026287 [Acacia pycnantha]
MILFKTAPLVAGAGACDPDGVAAVDVVGELAGIDLGDSDGDDMGGEGGELTVAGDCRAIVELTNKAATSINTILKLAIIEKEEKFLRTEILSERSSSGNGARL